MESPKFNKDDLEYDEIPEERLNKIFEKHETLFCMLLIGVYIAVNSVCVQMFGYMLFAQQVVSHLLSEKFYP